MQDDKVSDEFDGSRRWRPDDPRRLRMAEKRMSILQAARPIVLRDGLGGVTLDRIAAEGRIAKMTLYRHFSSKDALVAGLVDAMCSEMRDAIENAPSAAEDVPCRQRLSNELHGFAFALIQPDSLALYRLIVAEGWRLPGIARAFDESGMRVIRARLAALLETGGVDPSRSWDVAGEVVALTLGDAYQRAILGIAKDDDPAAFSRQIAVAVDHALPAAAAEASAAEPSRSRTASKKVQGSRR